MKDNQDTETQGSLMDDTIINGTPFSVLMSQAIKLKTVQDAPTRSNYDSYSTFYKNSIFPREEVLSARTKPFKERMNDAIQFKMDGNTAMQENCYAEAIIKYEIALSVFKYLENVNPDWKTEVSEEDKIIL